MTEAASAADPARQETISRVQASYEAWQAQLTADERDAFAVMQQQQADALEDAEPRYSVGASRFAHAYDTLPVSCALISRYGADVAVMFAFFEKFSARGEKDFFGGAPLLEQFTGLGERTYRRRAELIADGLMNEIEPTGYDRRKRLALDMHEKHTLTLDHAERLAARCAEHRNWRGLVDRLAYVATSDDDNTKGFPSLQNVDKGQPDQGEPSRQSVGMDTGKTSISEVNGFKEVCKPNPSRAHASGTEDAHPAPTRSREPGEDDEETPTPTTGANAAEMLTAFCKANDVTHKAAVITLYTSGNNVTQTEAAQLIARAHEFNAGDGEPVKHWKWFEAELSKLRDRRGYSRLTPVGGHYDEATTRRVLRTQDEYGERLKREKDDPAKVERAESYLGDALAAARSANVKARTRFRS